ncbi:proheparin-binding EGF-like growth factor [Protopterus annectens]|uniref:proheparin-binding EGF-like growth factor n=1 Tax=Protopterus annectens TaxID=7888 RepID=UPI001CFA098D|nr:proheparin-binding EGF-like growth factor [Protopterus annectens]
MGFYHVFAMSNCVMRSYTMTWTSCQMLFVAAALFFGALSIPAEGAAIENEVAIKLRHDSGPSITLPPAVPEPYYQEEEDDEEYDIDGATDEDYHLSGDYDEEELPRVAFSSKPQGLVTLNKEEKRTRKGKKKGAGKKRNPCLKKYKDFCIHGECRYIRELKAPACNCWTGYHGERCHQFTLPVENPQPGYDHTTVLAVTAVVLSSVCLILIAALLVLRYHKRGEYDVENEEKVKLGETVGH